ncbi:Transposase [Limihaloglobus sulfuriphilus]|uniref:Transposase n=2 Tax=Limihaloglobus sulfuriphilus TaxID=1851148 RepID=A0A1Q2MJA4_9BACT|nr:Transposase [Limihaloglobus sulfuriphilus]
MYDWRKMTPQERAETLRLRKQLIRPWHSPPHWDSGESRYYIVSAACYEHKHIAGAVFSRLAMLEKSVLEICESCSEKTIAWSILPNHYHVLVKTEHITELRYSLGRMHGRLSRQWNLEDNCLGRKVWHNCVERIIRSERHYWATVNYIHHNAVKHGFAQRWEQWVFCSAVQFLNEVGREKAKEIWKAYPVLDYGKEWDK